MRQRQYTVQVTEQTPSPRVGRRRRFVLLSVGVAGVVALLVAGLWWAAAPRGVQDAPTPTASGSPAPSPSPTPTVVAAPVEKPKAFFNRAARPIDAADSIWVVSNKLRPLSPIDYAPADLVRASVPGAGTDSTNMRAEAAAAMEALFAAATDSGVRLVVQNAYRSYDTQVSLHERLVGQLGRERARAQSAMPGYSEHQTGLTADIMAANGVCTIQACFAATPEGAWLAENAWIFGFHLRYPEGKTDVTGYIFEPWHYRYVGTELAAELHATQTPTLEEFFGLPPAPDYPPGV